MSTSKPALRFCGIVVARGDLGKAALPFATAFTKGRIFAMIDMLMLQWMMLR
jgi:hypothetical protein